MTANSINTARIDFPSDGWIYIGSLKRQGKKQGIDQQSKKEKSGHKPDPDKGIRAKSHPKSPQNQDQSAQKKELLKDLVLKCNFIEIINKIQDKRQ